MTLKINSAYKTATGYIIPRSHMFQGKGVKYAIFEVIAGGDGKYVKKHATYTTTELRKVLALTKNERVEII